MESKLVSPAQPIKWHVETDCIFLHMFLERWSCPFWTIWWCVGSAWIIESVSAASRLHPTQLLETYWTFLHSAHNPPEWEALLEYTAPKWDLHIYRGRGGGRTNKTEPMRSPPRILGNIVPRYANVSLGAILGPIYLMLSYTGRLCWTLVVNDEDSCLCTKFVCLECKWVMTDLAWERTDYC